MRNAAIFLRSSITLCLASLLTGVLISAAAVADVHVEAIMVQPVSPGPSALCQLKVRLKNSGTRSVSFFRFNVKINGQDEPVYKVYSYAINIDPGSSGELELNGFYSPSETKTFEVQVTLVEAQWVEVKKDGRSSTTTPSGVVTGLPTSSSLSVKMSPSKS